jgi:hypothetical protein
MAAVAAVVVVALAGCGKPAAAGSTPSSKASAEQAQLQFTRCMRDHGANIQDAKPNTGNAGGGFNISVNGGDHGTLDAAMKACEKYMPKAGGPPPDPAEMQAAFDRALKFAQCMRQHGVNMPDPKQASGGMGIMQQGPDSVDPSSKTFQDAQKACEQFFGPPGGKGGQGPSTQIQGGDGKGGGSGAVIGNG